ncbi:fumarylacetoacetate hydrolase family protein [Siphonobacter aquaeclarae]|jgi:2,4-diketo-3-deoxy-L-fuconate hydrolase|uniref:2-keto-4-pentenoate hydratase/2-oxohepta-3-ene-1,7-dioic acid hydratase (Catechol pathway) n=1 Tax=Siphonobacter aquaeclarae TaxID=563176 RepID=A0A1G9SHK8_9BACT|nr:fumarylacetoacetate hydrolase family protein [Siphonobacter aquaeclarae]MBO9636961.1 fumarylacetoacetate hydrolase family protein [Siphonobacter aquaeclarae]SDM34974.1 2-keto-4-pentenoate hydratase/2-oxohepta-3-ene-1,7-dioic acid hydratase (catechol pathway) [Siphonobacter aquaeclarae]
MKLFRYVTEEDVIPGILIDGKPYSLEGFFEAFGEETGAYDLDEYFFEEEGIAVLEDYLEQYGTSELEPLDEDIQYASCVARPSKIICIGLNYADHAKETGAPIPQEPIIFFKATTALCGPNDDVVIPRNSVKTDWEVELAVVIGAECSYVTEEQAVDYIAGYAVMNDYSEREFQLERGGQWDKGKGCDTFGPLGPYLVTPDEVDDVDSLPMWLKVNGKTFQNSTTAQMIFKVPQVISYLSQFMTLLPGDVISTGTPPGVGLGFNPPIYLKPGDVVELGIEGLGEQRQVAVSWEDAN